MIKNIVLILGLLVSFVNAKEIKYLTSEEVNWLDTFSRDIRIGVTKIPNQVLLNKDDSLRGFSIDLFDIIVKKSGLKFKYVYFKSWEKLVQASKNNSIDVIFLAQKTSSRLQYLYFTDTVLTQQNKIIVNIDTKLKSLEDFNHYKVAITAGSALEEYIRFHYPNVTIVSTKSELESLKFVSSKKADATVLELVRASYYIRTFNLNNLVITSDIDYDYYLSIASSKKLPELNIILSKTFQNIKKTEIESLKLKWGYIKEKKLFFDKQTMIYLSIAFGIIIPFSIYLFLINQRLKLEMKEKEKALYRVEKLRNSKLNEMGEIISMIAHQWKQPVNNLNLLNQMLVLKYKKELLKEEFIKYFVDNSTKQINLLINTIDDFKDFFKIDEDKVKFSLKDMIENLIGITQPLYEKNNIKILFKYKDGDFIVENYQSMLFQIIINILNNAKDALNEIENKSKIIEITLIEKNNEKIIYLHDNAGGIAEDIIDKIFDPYFSTKKEKNGTGLGLYMAKVIIEERMQGKINVQNKGNGALFEIRLMS